MKPLQEWFINPAGRFGASSGLQASSDGTTKVLKRGIDYHRWVYKTMRTQHEFSKSPHELLIEPWFRTRKWDQRSPDMVLVDHEAKRALVIEVKLNWKAGREQKLLNEYLPIVASAFRVETKPVLLTNCLRGWDGPVLLGLRQLPLAWDWKTGDELPVLLLPKRGA